MRSFRFAVAAAVAASSFALTSTAMGALDPARADADVKAARESGVGEFCTSPPKPLPNHARRLCAHAKEIPSCEAFVAACADAESVTAAKTAPSSSPSSPPSVAAAGLGAVAQILVWLLVAAVVAGVVFLVVQALLRMRRDVALADPIATPKDAEQTHAVDEVTVLSDAETLLARADAQARSGELRAALFTYLAAALRALDQRGVIRMARDRTNGEYVRACKDAAARAPLRSIVGDVDRVQFGGESASADAVTRAAQQATALVRAMPAMVLAIAFAFATTACGSGRATPAPSAKADDPGGSEIFIALMRKQGVAVTRASSSLATLPMPSALPGSCASGRCGPETVVIDTDRIVIDEETAAHLMRWVEAGGALILAGRPEAWPKELGAKSTTASGDHVTVWRTDDHDDGRVGAPPPLVAILAKPLAIATTDAPLASFANGETYASIRRPGAEGIIVGIATNELLTNAALARPGNAAALIGLLTIIDPSELHLARSEDAIAPPSNPISGMLRAGLGLGLGHALALALVLFLAVGIRLARPRPTPPPARRAFAESVEASGALYARAKMASHALASYARFVDERIRTKMPRRRDAESHAHTTDVAAFLAARAGADPATCERVWQRAKNTRPGDPPRGDELDLLKELTALYAAATKA